MDNPLTILPPKDGRLRYWYRDHIITVVGKFYQIDDYTDVAHFGDSLDDAMRMIDEIFFEPQSSEAIENDRNWCLGYIRNAAPAACELADCNDLKQMVRVLIDHAWRAVK